MDILGPITKSAKSQQYIMVIIDWFTKFSRADPLTSTITAAVAQDFLEYWAYVYGVPTC